MAGNLQGLFGRLGQGLENSSGTLLALGGGLLNHRADARNPMFDPQSMMVAQTADLGRRKLRKEEAELEVKKNMTRSWLTETLGLPEPEVEAALANPDILTYYMKQAADSADGGGDEFSMAPVYLENEDGTLGIGQLSKGGGIRMTELPEGVTLAPGTKEINAGTETLVVDRTGAVIARYPKNVAETAAQEVRGKTQGENEAALPGAELQADQLISTIDSVVDHPARELATGRSRNLNPRAYLNNEVRDFDNRINQLRGEAFLEARQALKGGGSVSDTESAKAEQAKARMDAAVNDDDFLAALKDFRDAVELGMRKLQADANRPVTYEAPAPAGGTDLRQKYNLE